MFIKISSNPERYVNTDNIEAVTFGRLQRSQTNQQQTRGCILDFRSGRTIPVSDAAGRVLIEFADSNSAFLDEPLPGPTVAPDNQPPVTTASVKSKIAQFLRDEAPNGAMIMDLVMKFPGKDGEIPIALDELQEERVVILHADRYYHASNAPRPAPTENTEF